MKTILFSLLLLFFCCCSIAFAQDNTDPNPGVTCPYGLSPYLCFVAPCSNPPPPDCKYDHCVDDYCGGCNRIYYDANKTRVCDSCMKNPDLCGEKPMLPTIQCSDGTFGGLTGNCISTPDGHCAWEIRECPPVQCGPVCLMWCEYGNVLDDQGCPTCQCKQPPTCDQSGCPTLICPEGEVPYLSPVDNTCCPKCVSKCEAVDCAPILCDSGSVQVTPFGECCPVCSPVCNFECPQVECKPGYQLVKKSCCASCEPVVDCSVIQCPEAVCAADEKLTFPDGTCCGKCVPAPVNPCNDTFCIQTVCPDGQKLVKTETDCCGTCVPVTFCLAVLCAEPNCLESERVQREGQCCPNCKVCQDTDTTKCDNWENSVCKPGEYTGTNCTVPVPPTDKVESVLYISFCQTAPCTAWTEDQVKLLLTALSGVGREHFTVTVYTTNTEKECCAFFKVVLTGTKGSFDANQAKDQVEASIASDPRLSLTPTEMTTAAPASTTTTSSSMIDSEASTVVGVSTLLLLLLLLSLFF